MIINIQKLLLINFLDQGKKLIKNDSDILFIKIKKFIKNNLYKFMRSKLILNKLIYNVSINVNILIII